MTDPKLKNRKADHMRRIAEDLTNPKDADLVRAYANELAAAPRAKGERLHLAGSAAPAPT